MGVTLGDICAALQGAGYDVGVFAQTDRQVTGLHLLTSVGDRPDKDALNLCPANVFAQAEVRAGMSFVCVGGGSVSPELAARSGADVLLLRGGAGLTEAANIIMRELSDSAFAAGVGARMFAALADEDALKQIVNIAGEAIGCQMVLADTYHNVLVHNVADIPIEEDSWDVFVGRGVAPGFNRSSGCRIYDKVELSHGSVLNLVDNARLGVSNAICDIMAGGRQIACLSILTDKTPFCGRQYRVVSALCDAIVLELQNHGRPDTVRALSYEAFLINLLESRVRNPEHIRVLASKIMMPFESYFAVFVFEIPEGEFGRATQAPLREMVDGVEAALIESRAVSYNGRIVVLVDYHDRNGFAAQDYTQVKELISLWGLRCGMSRPFNRLSDIHKHFLEALDSAEIAKYTAFIADPVFGDINYYERCEPFILMHDAAEHGVDLRKFVHPFAIKLNDYDMEHDTEYIRTLFEYIRTPKKPQAAEALFIHRNTLDYRLKKIQELVEVPWDDGETLARMFFSIIILMYLDAREKYNNGGASA